MNINKKFTISNDNSYLDVVNNIKYELKSMDIVYKTVQIVVRYRCLSVSDFDVIKRDVIEMGSSDEIKGILEQLFKCGKNEKEVNDYANKVIVLLNEIVEWIKRAISTNPDMEKFFNIEELYIIKNKFEICA